MSKEDLKPHILFITGASHERNERNYNHFQRVYFLSREFDMTILARPHAKFDLSAAPQTRIVRSWLPWKTGLLLLSMYWLVFQRFRIKAPARQVVLLTEPSVVNLVGPLYKLFWHCKWVVDIWDIPIRAIDVHGLTRLRCTFFRWCLKQCFRCADLFLLSLLPDIEFKYFGIPPQKIASFPNAVFLPEQLPAHLPVLPRNENTFQVICQRSSYNSIMGLDILARGYELFSARCPDSRLVIVGKIPDAIRGQVKSLEGRKDVNLPGVMDHEALQRITEESGAMVIPFRNVPDLAQCYPIKMVEAMLAGTPLVVPALAVFQKALRPDETALLYKADDPEALASALERLYRSDSLRREIAGKAYMEIRRFDCAEKNRKIIESIERLTQKERK